MQHQVFVIGSASVAAWLPEFCGPSGPETLFTVPSGCAELIAVAQQRRVREFVFVSDHATLARDRSWAVELRRLGHRVRCQSPAAVGLAQDKAAMKRELELAGVPTLPWRTHDEYSPGWPGASGAVVLKQRSGTQSEGIRIGTAVERPEPDEYSEVYQEGIEYSVNVFARSGEAVVLPPVWKGPTSQELVPPWRRTRICAPGTADHALARTLRLIARRIAAFFDADGFMEIEYLVREDGEVVVLEVNPRVSGTLRISALAAARPVFSWYADMPADPVAAAVACAVEVPNRGRQLMLPSLGLFATSRITVAGANPDDLAARIARLREIGALDRATTNLLNEALGTLRAPLPDLVGN